MSTASIARRLNIGLVISLLVAAVLLGVVAIVLFERALREHALQSLHSDAQALLAAIERQPSGLSLDASRLNPIYNRPLSGRYFIIEGGRHRWRSRSLWDSELGTLPSSPGSVPGLVSGPLGQKLLVLRTDYRRYSTDFKLTVAADVAPLLSKFNRIGLLLLTLGSLAVLVLLFLQRIWIRQTLKPLDVARQQLNELQQGQREWLETRSPAELKPLLTELNRLLQFNRQSLGRSRRALGNLGHALKTPLAILVTLAERSEPELRDRLQEQLSLMQNRISRELNRARTAGNVMAGVWFSPQQEIPLLVKSLQLAHPDAPRIRWSAPEDPVPLERDDLLELLGNLLDNACKWAQNEITLSLSIETGSRFKTCLLVELADDGPGIEQNRSKHVLSRGIRLDEKTEGHGLGLSIVDDIVAAYEGQISLARADPGGLAITVRLPLSRTT